MLKAIHHFLSLLVIFLLISIGGFTYLYVKFTEPGPLQVEKSVVIPKGAGVSSIANILLKENVISNEFIFETGILFLEAETQLKAGEYIFEQNISQKQVVKKLKKGDVVLRKITLVEGLTSKSIVNVLNATEGLFGELEKIPTEGSLFPDTYYFSYGDTKQDIISRMQKRMDEVVNDLWSQRHKNLPFKTKEAAITLASIVEKETGLTHERPRVAAVFVNRLKKGMPLQSDPTIIYSLSNQSGKLDRALTRKDLKTPDPYNTYLNGGLPPGPIASPGKDSILAVLTPISSNEYYFVADGKGGHAFAKTLNEHNRNVEKWREFQNSIKTE